MITISFHVRVRVNVAGDNWETPEAIGRQLSDEIKSNLMSLSRSQGLDVVSADVTRIGHGVKP